MTITIPNIESLPPNHHLNRQIDGLNRGQRMDNMYRASVAAAIARFLAERLRADTDLDWIREVNRLIDGIRLDMPTVENVYADLGETERFKAGQTVTVKYHAASGRATLSGEFHWRLMFMIVFMGSAVVVMGIVGYRGGT